MKTDKTPLSGPVDASGEPERMFPIQDGPDIPWAVIAPFDKRCQRNHGGQTLEKLASRGGLGCLEALAVLHDEDFYKRYPASLPRGEDAILELVALIAQRAAAAVPSPARRCTCSENFANPEPYCAVHDPGRPVSTRTGGKYVHGRQLEAALASSPVAEAIEIQERSFRLEFVNVILSMLYMANIDTDECVRLEREICDLANEVIPRLLAKTTMREHSSMEAVAGSLPDPERGPSKPDDAGSNPAARTTRPSAPSSSAAADKETR